MTGQETYANGVEDCICWLLAQSETVAAGTALHTAITDIDLPPLEVLIAHVEERKAELQERFIGDDEDKDEMKFYVLGYDQTRIVFMTQEAFTSLDAAVKYADSCAKAWRAFVVQKV